MGETRDVIERWWDRFEARDWDATVALVDPDCEWTTPDATLRGAQQVEGLIRAYATAFPDLHHEFRSFVESGDVAAMEIVLTGTHRGVLATPAGEVPPTGRPIRFRFCDVITVSDGLMVSVRSYYDTLDLAGQLGLIPPPGQGANAPA